MEKIISLKIKLGVAKYILLEVAKYKNIPNLFWGSHDYLSLTLATAPDSTRSRFHWLFQYIKIITLMITEVGCEKYLLQQLLNFVFDRFFVTLFQLSLWLYLVHALFALEMMKLFTQGRSRQFRGPVIILTFFHLKIIEEKKKLTPLIVTDSWVVVKYIINRLNRSFTHRKIDIYLWIMQIDSKIVVFQTFSYGKRTFNDGFCPWVQVFLDFFKFWGHSNSDGKM